MRRFVALDFETSGKDPGRHAPVSLGIALFLDGQVIDHQEWIIAPPRDSKGRISKEYDVFALKISGITLGQIEKGTPGAQVADELMDWAIQNDARDLPIIAFNAPFDLAFYSNLLFNAGGWGPVRGQWLPHTAPLRGPWQCALMIAREELALAGYKLDDVAAHYGLTRSTELHGACEDAILAGRIFDRLNKAKVAA